MAVSERTIELIYETVKDLCEVKHAAPIPKSVVRTVVHAMSIISTANKQMEKQE